MIDYKAELVYIGENPYSLLRLKNFLIQFYPELVQKFYIRTVFTQGVFTEQTISKSATSICIERNIYRKGKTVFSYDWKEILRRAEQTVLPLHEFISLQG